MISQFNPERLALSGLNCVLGHDDGGTRYTVRCLESERL